MLTFAVELVRNGFRVWHNPQNPAYIFAAVDGQIGYLQTQIGVGYRYFTVHKPNLKTGTGFHFADGFLLNVETMRNCCKSIAPGWYRGETVQKWTLEEWLKDNPHLIEMNHEPQG